MTLCLSLPRPLCPSASIPLYPSIPHLLCPLALLSSRFPLPCPLFPSGTLYLDLCAPQLLVPWHLCPLSPLLQLYSPSASLSLSISVPRLLCLFASLSLVLSFVSLCSLLSFCPSTTLFILVTQPCGPLAYLSFSVYLSASPFLNHSVSWPLSPSASVPKPLRPSAIGLCVECSLCPLNLCHSASLSFTLHITWLLCHSASLSLVLSVVWPLCPSVSISIGLCAALSLNLCDPLLLFPLAPQSLSPSAIGLCVAWSLCPPFSVALGLSVPQPLCCSASLSRDLTVAQHFIFCPVCPSSCLSRCPSVPRPLFPSAYLSLGLRSAGPLCSLASVPSSLCVPLHLCSSASVSL